MQLDQVQRNAASGRGGGPQGGFNPLVPELDVTDIEKSLWFWCDLLGFEVAYDRPKAKFAYLQREGAQIMLCQINGNWQTGTLEAPFGRGVNFQIAARNLDPMLKALADAGWPLFREPSEAWYRIGDQLMENGSREFLVQDPDGYLIRFAESIGSRPIGD
ncbi:bleomycin resistance protein [Microvirga alba]|uniref:Bleomycin resistance protein n=1 Tax=Microvirga alba TaxID=2791025 RepID=A0A931FMC0_9HYPH|nr:VOC family protein [Microvirga alba]MBF9232939.1 VOC family protein [Microvirga alba]